MCVHVYLRACPKCKVFWPAYIQYIDHNGWPVYLSPSPLPSPEIDWAGLVIQKLRSDEYIGSIHTVDTPLLDHTPLLSDEAKDPFTSFLMFYSARSVEFPQPILTDTPQTQDCESRHGTVNLGMGL